MCAEAKSERATCSWKGESGGRACSEAAWGDTPFCILHVQDKGEGFDLFVQRIADKLVQKDYVFSGVVFPEEGSFTLYGVIGSADFSEARFLGPAVFDRAKFSENADFSHAEFGAEASFYDAEFLKQADFTAATFFERATFHGTAFRGTANFGQTVLKSASYFGAFFSDTAYFRGAKFSKDANFRGATFGCVAEFTHAEFVTADFVGADFHSLAHFGSARFRSEVDFSHVSFGGLAAFLNAEFSGERTDFRQAKFRDIAEFQFSRFDGSAKFDICGFAKVANFYRVEFQDSRFAEAEFGGEAHFERMRSAVGADFAKATFRDKAFFREARFEKGVGFHDTAFEKTAEFRSAFLLDSDFGYTRFVGEVSFSQTYFTGSQQNTSASAKGPFSGATTFSKAFFGETAYFTDAVFHCPVDFCGASFGGPAFFVLHPSSGAPASGSKGSASASEVTGHNPEPEVLEICFENVFIGQPSSVRFDGVDLSHTTLAGSNVRSVSFHNCGWPRIRRRFAAFDELCPLHQGAEAIRLLYRDMKANFEDSRDWVIAGDFYYGEMEISRKWRRGERDRWHWVRRFLSPYTIYWLSSGYGEHPVRALWFFGALTLAFAALLHFTTFTLHGQALNTPSWAASLGHSLRALTLQRSFYVEPASEWAYRITLLANLLGPIQLAQIAISLRRRFRR